MVPPAISPVEGPPPPSPPPPPVHFNSTGSNVGQLRTTTVTNHLEFQYLDYFQEVKTVQSLTYEWLKGYDTPNLKIRQALQVFPGAVGVYLGHLYSTHQKANLMWPICEVALHYKEVVLAFGFQKFFFSFQLLEVDNFFVMVKFELRVKISIMPQKLRHPHSQT